MLARREACLSGCCGSMLKGDEPRNQKRSAERSCASGAWEVLLLRGSEQAELGRHVDLIVARAAMIPGSRRRLHSVEFFRWLRASGLMCLSVGGAVVSRWACRGRGRIFAVGRHVLRSLHPSQALGPWGSVQIKLLGGPLGRVGAAWRRYLGCVITGSRRSAVKNRRRAAPGSWASCDEVEKEFEPSRITCYGKSAEQVTGAVPPATWGGASNAGVGCCCKR